MGCSPGQRDFLRLDLVKISFVSLLQGYALTGNSHRLASFVWQSKAPFDQIVVLNRPCRVRVLQQKSG